MNKYYRYLLLLIGVALFFYSFIPSGKVLWITIVIWLACGAWALGIVVCDSWAGGIKGRESISPNREFLGCMVLCVLGLVSLFLVALTPAYARKILP